MSSKPAIEAHGLHKSYKLGRVDLNVLKGVDITVQHGQFLSIVGASGSGKSTLLHLLGLLDTQDKGTISIEGEDVSRFSAHRRDRIRCRDIGFVFQFYHLLPELNVLQNVVMPAMVNSSLFGWPAQKSRCRKQAAEILERLGLSDRLRHRPSELSGGERQRVAIARALMNKPKLLLADEPTGNLDSKTGRQIIKLLKQLNSESGQTIIMVTHDTTLAEQADRVLHMHDGRLE